MSALGPELLPEGITLAEALPHLFILAALFFALGGIQMVTAFVRALFWGIETGVGWIPFAGKVVKVPIHKIEQRVTNALGSAVNALDGYIAHSWHQLARLTRQMGREIEGLAHDLWLLTAVIPGLVTEIALRRLFAAVLHPIRATQRLLRAAARAEAAALHLVQRTATHVLTPRLGALEHELDRVLEVDIPALRARTKALERRAMRSYEWLRKHERSLAAVAFSGAVAMSLRRLRLGWLRCRNWRRIGPHVCGLPASLIEDLLGLSFAFGVLANPEEIARLALDVETPIEALVRKILD